MHKAKMIGIVGGLGPYAGVELCKDVLDFTNASRDQEYLPMVMISVPGETSDRTDFILGKTDENPAYAIIEVIKKLAMVGCEVIGIGCNTSHAAQIYNVILEELEIQKIQVKVINMVDEVVNQICTCYPDAKKVGVLSTIGCYTAKVYEHALMKADLKPIIPDNDICENMIHKAVYDEKFGIKTISNPVTSEAKKLLMGAISRLKEENVDVVILGCTEISLAIKDEIIDGIRVVDSSKVLANALIKQSLQK